MQVFIHQSSLKYNIYVELELVFEIDILFILNIKLFQSKVL